jgi:hypothetical protein
VLSFGGVGAGRYGEAALDSSFVLTSRTMVRDNDRTVRSLYVALREMSMTNRPTWVSLAEGMTDWTAAK